MEEDPPMGIPEWVVTFGDMMSLLLTFFIMLVSMSEMKSEEKFQAMVESMRKQFGHDKASASVSPGDHLSRTKDIAVLATMGRAMKKDTHKGGAPTEAPVGDNERVRVIRPGDSTAIGTVVFFKDGTVELDKDSQAALDEEVKQLAGKPQKIEIRGHTAQQLAAQGPNPMDAMDLGYRRCRAVMNYLVQKHQIPPERIRLSSAGAWEPMFQSSDTEKVRLNPRVEVFLLQETVEELIGTAEERDENVLKTNASK
ncbi:OmpA/MotB family protein [Aureliella helgolandensis]|uniref:Flagellar motor protein MotB n=1 Tax=Aureliella helgolandensis TaxID=2527968 RepID=A0A518GGN5_9BACT|nr:flagellar motor protein MotB [Aureliella helgolandensis]QDV27737.1 flagellar motor protein MotB [Aureliella helgolandensis]